MNQEDCQSYLQSIYYHPAMTYGERLQLAMDERGVDRKTLADAIGLGRHAIGMVITGGGREERWLSRENNQAAAKFLRVNSHWLFTGEGDMQEGSATVAATNESTFAKAIAQLYDTLPADAALRAKVFGEVCAVILAATRQGSAPTSEPDPAQIPRKQSERLQ